MKTRVLIGIPTLNGPDRLHRCLNSIIAYTNLSKFDIRVIVADDGSTEENLALNKNMIHVASLHIPVELLYGHGRTGIAASWNRCVRHANDTSEIVVLINDDIEVVEDWLDVIVFSLLNNPKIGMLGLNTYCGVTSQQYLNTFQTSPRIDYIEASLLVGNGALVSSHGPIFAFRREVYDVVGGFDERYFCFYEEVDFGIALRRQGYIHCMASYPLCFHMGGATNSDVKNLDAQKYLKESREKFFTKWEKTLDELRNEMKIDKESPKSTFIKQEWNTQIKNWV
jgi:GT2 family glycosyltransferase